MTRATAAGPVPKLTLTDTFVDERLPRDEDRHDELCVVVINELGETHTLRDSEAKQLPGSFLRSSITRSQKAGSMTSAARRNLQSVPWRRLERPRTVPRYAVPWQIREGVIASGIKSRRSDRR